MDVGKTLELSLKDVYQLLIAECRYGYSRNNHLMPDGAWDKVKYIVPRMYEVDEDWALHTIKQLCEECITDELCACFHDGLDNENGNRKGAIKFVRWCMDWIHEKEGDRHTYNYGNGETTHEWRPYCWDRFLNNLAKDDEPRYMIYELIGKKKKLITEKPVSENQWQNYVFTEENLDENKSAEYHHIVMRGDIASPNYLPYAKALVKYEFIAPTKKVYLREYVGRDGK